MSWSPFDLFRNSQETEGVVVATTTVGCWTTSEEHNEVTTALEWREGPLYPEQPGDMEGRELDQPHSFGAWERQ